MGNTGARVQSLSRHLAPNSRLAQLIADFDARGSDVAALLASPDASIRAIGIATHTASGGGLDTLPLEIVRNDLIIPALYEDGLPRGPRPSWLEKLIDEKTLLIQKLASLQPPFKKQRRCGHPGPDRILRGIVYATYLKTWNEVSSGTTKRTIFNMVTARLGPGISSHQIQREVHNYEADLRRVAKPWREFMFLAMREFTSHVRQYDERFPPKGVNARKLDTLGAVLSFKLRAQ